MSQNQAHGDSGACYGDSGGPTFLGAAESEGDVVVAVTSTGDNPCYSTNVSGRTDTASAQGLPLGLRALAGPRKWWGARVALHPLRLSRRQSPCDARGQPAA